MGIPFNIDSNAWAQMDPRTTLTDWQNLRSEVANAHHVLDILGINRDEYDEEKGFSKLTLLGRMRLLETECRRLGM